MDNEGNFDEIAASKETDRIVLSNLLFKLNISAAKDHKYLFIYILYWCWKFSSIVFFELVVDNYYDILSVTHCTNRADISTATWTDRSDSCSREAVVVDFCFFKEASLRELVINKERNLK